MEYWQWWDLTIKSNPLKADKLASKDILLIVNFATVNICSMAKDADYFKRFHLPDFSGSYTSICFIRYSHLFSFEVPPLGKSVR